VEVEQVDFLSICTQDLPRSRRFYLEALGLPFENETSVGFECTAGQVTLSVWNPASAGLPFAPNPNHIALRVSDVTRVRGELEANGIRFLGDILDTGVCHMAFFHDPDGNALMLHRRYAPHAD
jgi:catechol 2,3-dioxygenase-like lactoylglutathione lyase family enzyme